MTLKCYFYTTGKYSSYAPVSKTLGTPEYEAFLQEIAPVDDMIDALSLAMARGADDESLMKLLPYQWSIYQEERTKQLRKEGELVAQLASEGNGREKIVEAWRYQ